MFIRTAIFDICYMWQKILKSFHFPVKLNMPTDITCEESRIVREMLRKAVLLNLGYILGSLGELSKRQMTGVLPKLLPHDSHAEN